MGQMLREGAELMFLSEQHWDEDSPSWYFNPSGIATVWVRDTVNLRVENHGLRPDLVSCGKNNIFQFYLATNKPISVFWEKFDTLRTRSKILKSRNWTRLQ